MSRKQALEKLKKPPFDEIEIKNDFEYVANKLRISVSKLDEYLRLPIKSYKDYRSQDLIYKIGSIVSKKMNIEKGGKR